MRFDRQLLIATLLAGMTVITAVLLGGLVGTLFFAITVAYVLVPFAEVIADRGVPRWWAAAVATAGAFVFGLALFLPIGAVLYLQRRAIIAYLRSLPASMTISFAGFEFAVEAGEVGAFVGRQLSVVAITLARQTPVMAAKLIVFAFVVFALVYRGDRLQRVLLAPLDDDYHDIAHDLHERVRETLFSLYVIQAVTSIATFLVALVVFRLLGVPFPVTLAVLAGILQFLPVVGPSLVIAAVVLADLIAGDIGHAVVVGVVGVVFVGVLPDALLRPRLARETGRIPASLYFVGFTGGLLSLGPVGIVAGPLAIALLIELLQMLGQSVGATRRATPEPG